VFFIFLAYDNSSYYYSSFFLPSVKSLSDTFLGDALIKLDETLQEYHMPCEVVPLRVDFFQNGPLFISMATAAKFFLPIPILLAYLVPLDVDVTGNITAKICEILSEFNIFCTLVTMTMAAILNLSW
jgi:hypothetical protein